MKTYSCEFCKKEFTKGHWHGKIRFCSQKCRTVGLSPEFYKHRCQNCGADPMEPCRDDENNVAKICYSRRHSKPKPCEFCGVEIIATDKTKYCSAGCRKNNNKPVTPPKVEKKRKCDICETEFLTNDGKGKYCSAACRRIKRLADQRKTREAEKQIAYCLHCKKQFTKSLLHRTLCSKDCYHARQAIADEKKKYKSM